MAVALIAPIVTSEETAIAVLEENGEIEWSNPKIVHFGYESSELNVSLSGPFQVNQTVKVKICKVGTTLTLTSACEKLVDGDVKYEVEFPASSSQPRTQKVQWNTNGALSIIGLVAAVEEGSKVSKGVVGISGAQSTAYTQRPFGAVICQLQPISDSINMKVRGRFEIWDETSPDGAVNVKGRVENLPGPGGLSYGVHIHQWGNLNSLDGSSTSGHYNPDDKSHRLPGGGEEEEEEGHMGDLGNIAFYDNEGIAWYSEEKLKSPKIDISKIAGRALVVHSQMDDGCTQPTGGAGRRLAFCVLSVASQADITLKNTPKFDIPKQQGSKGCSLANTPDKPAKSTSFIWMTVIISLALAGIGILFTYNWWRARNNPAGSNATGRSLWFPQPESDDEEIASP
jgi:Cu-Zn family superoxide dismutase